ncbi:exopolysaccharide biosynthesis protein [Tropicimonas sp. IMCC34011]|uniref:exopolysaccharide biosynthesis protein n=1 Tax=Tropicimonas sp. IMCC34011 TaxID=2248759 RepID=UPI000E2239DB|nr:exopolysaccharide biosynthesis protein [Tropicimonas sp. IMCC34011]
MTENTHAVEDIFDRLDDAAKQSDSVSVGRLVEAFGGRGWGPLLFIPAIVEVSPIGGIPGVPTFLALIIALFAVQILAGRDSMWLPSFISNRSVSSDKMQGAMDKMRPLGRWLDRWFGPRLSSLTTRWVRRISAAVILMLCAIVPPLELVPFASTAPMAAIAMFGLSMTLRDGLLMAIGFVLSLGAAGICAYFLLGSGMGFGG